jgi:hypothetical protein
LATPQKQLIKRINWIKSFQILQPHARVTQTWFGSGIHEYTSAKIRLRKLALFANFDRTLEMPPLVMALHELPQSFRGKTSTIAKPVLKRSLKGARALLITFVFESERISRLSCNYLVMSSSHFHHLLIFVY